MPNIIQPEQFLAALREKLKNIDATKVGAVTGPGRSGAIASVYASHLLGIPFIPYGSKCPDRLFPILLIDTATSSGRTLRRAERRLQDRGEVITVAVYHEPPRVIFWYESQALNT